MASVDRAGFLCGGVGVEERLREPERPRVGGGICGGDAGVADPAGCLFHAEELRMVQHPAHPARQVTISSLRKYFLERLPVAQPPGISLGRRPRQFLLDRESQETRLDSTDRAHIAGSGGAPSTPGRCSSAVERRL